MFFPEVSGRVGFRDRPRQSLLRQFVFAAQEDVGDVGLVGIGRQNHSLDQLVWIAFHQMAIFEGARLHLVGVGDQVLGSRSIGAHGSKAPLQSGGETGAAAAAQAGVLDFLLNFLGVMSRKALRSALISAGMLVALEVESLAIRRDVFGERLLQ